MRTTMIQRIEVSITDRCNLNCAYCSHYASLCKDTKDMSLRTFVNDIQRLGFITLRGKELGTLGILGGEPFLNKDLLDMCVIAREELPYSRVRITTNGIYLLNLTGQQLGILRRNDVEILISKYLNDTSFYNEIERVLNEYHIIYKYTQGGTITNFSKFYMDETGNQFRVTSHDNCTLCKGTYTCHELRNGYIYPCSQIVRADVLNKHFGTNFKITDKDRISINCSRFEIESFLKDNIPDFCRYCKTKEWNNNQGTYTRSKDIKEEYI